MAEEEGKWVTLDNGVHLFIKKGQTLDDAIEQNIAKGDKEKPKQDNKSKVLEKNGITTKNLSDKEKEDKYNQVGGDRNWANKAYGDEDNDIEDGKKDWVKTEEDEEVWSSLSDDEKKLLTYSSDMGFWYDEVLGNDEIKEKYDELSSRFSKSQKKNMDRNKIEQVIKSREFELKRNGENEQEFVFKGDNPADKKRTFEELAEVLPKNVGLGMEGDTLFVSYRNDSQAKSDTKKENNNVDKDKIVDKLDNQTFRNSYHFLDWVGYETNNDFKWSNNKDGSMTIKAFGNEYNVKFKLNENYEKPEDKLQVNIKKVS